MPNPNDVIQALDAATGTIENRDRLLGMERDLALNLLSQLGATSGANPVGAGVHNPMSGSPPNGARLLGTPGLAGGWATASARCAGRAHCSTARITEPSGAPRCAGEPADQRANGRHICIESDAEPRSRANRRNRWSGCQRLGRAEVACRRENRQTEHGIGQFVWIGGSSVGSARSLLITESIHGTGNAQPLNHTSNL